MSNIKVFILEDCPNRMKWFREKFNEGITLYTATSVEAGKKVYEENGPFQLLLLDHDLADEHYEEHKGGEAVLKGSGTEFARWLVNEETQWARQHCEVVIHSLNPHGAERMRGILSKSGFCVVRKVPYIQLKRNIQ